MKLKRINRKEYQHLREIVLLKGMTLDVAKGLTKRSISLLALVRRFPTIEEYHEYTHAINKKSDLKRREKFQQIKKLESPKNEVMIPTIDPFKTEVVATLKRIEKHLSDLVEMKRRSIEYSKQKALHAWPKFFGKK